MLLQLHHVTAAGYCRKGARAWFKQRGWNYTDFLENGRDVADFEATGCQFAINAVAEARKESEDGR